MVAIIPFLKLRSKRLCFLYLFSLSENAYNNYWYYSSCWDRCFTSTGADCWVWFQSFLYHGKGIRQVCIFVLFFVAHLILQKQGY